MGESSSFMDQTVANDITPQLSKPQLVDSLTVHHASTDVLWTDVQGNPDTDDKPASPEAFKTMFCLRPNITFLNHGSFGATPRAVFAVYQGWQSYLEQQPVQFFRDELTDYLQRARASLAAYLSCNLLDVVFVPNATFGVNSVVNSLNLVPGDEVLSSNQEYGACDHTWQHWSEKRGFSYVKAPMALPFTDNLVNAFWTHVTPQTKVIFLSHITSATAQTLPIKEICARAREHNILTVIDGAHAPGQLPLNLPDLGADIYTGNCHKWLCSPKGAGFLYVHPEQQAHIEPLIVGWRRRNMPSLGSNFQNDFAFLGTADYSAYLSVPAAIQFQAQHAWGRVQARCHNLLTNAMTQWQQVAGVSSAYVSPNDYRQMALLEIPTQDDLREVQPEIWQRTGVEVPFTEHLGRAYARVSVQGYNGVGDMERLVEVLGTLTK